MPVTEHLRAVENPRSRARRCRKGDLLGAHDADRLLREARRCCATNGVHVVDRLIEAPALDLSPGSITPPSIATFAPVMKLAASDARTRRGRRPPRAVRCGRGGTLFEIFGNSMLQHPRTAEGVHEAGREQVDSDAMAPTSQTAPPQKTAQCSFEAAWCTGASTSPLGGEIADRQDAPAPGARSCDGRTARAKVPFAFTSITGPGPFRRAMSAMGSTCVMPALQTRISTPPRSLRTVTTTVFTWAASATLP